MGIFDAIRDSWIQASDSVDSPEYTELTRGCVLRVEERNDNFSVEYYHYGIYAGDEEVIHLRSNGYIVKTSIEEFIEDSINSGRIDIMSFPIDMINYISPEESYERALDKIGYHGYDLLNNNCEHFALWCRTGNALSTQAFNKESDCFLSLSFENFVGISTFVGIPTILGDFNSWRKGIEVSRTFNLNYTTIEDRYED